MYFVRQQLTKSVNLVISKWSHWSVISQIKDFIWHQWENRKNVLKKNELWHELPLSCKRLCYIILFALWYLVPALNIHFTISKAMAHSHIKLVVDLCLLVSKFSIITCQTFQLNPLKMQYSWTIWEQQYSSKLN